MELRKTLNLRVGAGAPLPPSEEGGGFLPLQGQKDGRRENARLLLTPRCRRTQNDTGIIIAWCPSIHTAFARTRCISPSVTAFLSFIRRATSLLRGRRGGCRRTSQIQLSVVQGSREALRKRSQQIFHRGAKNVPKSHSANRNVPRETFAEREIYFNKSI